MHLNEKNLLKLYLKEVISELKIRKNDATLSSLKKSKENIKKALASHLGANIRNNDSKPNHEMLDADAINNWIEKQKKPVDAAQIKKLLQSKKDRGEQ
jgi:hypothetical protein